MRNKDAPTANKCLSRTWELQRLQGHLVRLKETKAVLSTESPQVYPHLVHRAKKEQMMEERYTQIEYENRILLKKMSKILRTSSTENLNKHFKPKSLNAISRKKELKRIMDENQKILGAIQSRKPFYTRHDWDTHAQNHKGYRNTIMERPLQTLPTMYDRHDRTNSAPSPQKRLTDQSQPHHLAPINKKKSPAKSPNKRKGGGKKAIKKVPQEPLEIVRGGNTIDNKYVVLTVTEIMKPKHTLVFSTFDVDTSVSCELEIPFGDVEQVCADERLLSPENRKALVEGMLDRLHFKGDELLEFDGSVRCVICY